MASFSISAILGHSEQKNENPSLLGARNIPHESREDTDEKGKCASNFISKNYSLICRNASKELLLIA